MKLKNVITISGRICSGKSYAARLIQNELSVPIASFGAYLKYYCEQNHLPTDRKSLQDTGEAFIKANPKQFLTDVLSHYIGSADIIVLEGVRHQSILEEVNQLTENHQAVFIDADLETRYKRYFKRNKDSDEVKTFHQFEIADNHSVELEIESLKQNCDIVIDSTNVKDYQAVLLRCIAKRLSI